MGMGHQNLTKGERRRPPPPQTQIFSKLGGRIYVIEGTDTSVMNKNQTGSVAATATAANSDTKCTVKVTANQQYYIWAYYYNDASVNFTISNITFTPSVE